MVYGIITDKKKKILVVKINYRGSGDSVMAKEIENRGQKREKE